VSLIAEALQLRAAPEAKPKPPWQRFLESTGGAALITVLLGGMLGQCITAQVQKGQQDRQNQQAIESREREFEQAWVKARGDQALLAYQGYLKEEQETVKSAYDLIGSCISAADDLMATTRKDFNPKQYEHDRKQQEIVYEDIDEIRTNYIAVDKKWRAERVKLGLLMGYYHKGQGDVAEAWRATQEALTHYVDFAAGFAQHPPREDLSEEDVRNASRREREALQAALTSLSNSLDQNRQYGWEGWDNPERLKATLGIRTK
jgi:hypothetical protein